MTRDPRPLLHAVALASMALLVACGGSGTPSAPGQAGATPSPVVDPAPRHARADPAGPVAAGATVPTRFQGRYAADAAACDLSGHESRLELTLDHVTLHESSGPVRSVSTSGHLLTLVAEFSGEGGTRDAAYQFGLSEDGARLLDLANGLARRRCD